MKPNLLNQCRSCASSVDWMVVSYHEDLTEDDIREFENEVFWPAISGHQTLSESFIDEYSHKVNWSEISKRQTLSDAFLLDHYDKIVWEELPCRRSFSEDFIQTLDSYGYANWTLISRYQSLSEDFIEQFADKVDWDEISKHQTLSENFIDAYDAYLDIPENTWRYMTAQEKLDWVDAYTNFEIRDSRIVAHKSIRDDGYSVYCVHTFYEVGNTYTVANCDCIPSNSSSFGLTAWTPAAAPAYGRGRILEVEIDPANLGAVMDGYDAYGDYKKLRCFSFDVVDVVVP